MQSRSYTPAYRELAGGRKAQTFMTRSVYLVCALLVITSACGSSAGSEPTATLPSSMPAAGTSMPGSTTRLPPVAPSTSQIAEPTSSTTTPPWYLRLGPAPVDQCTSDAFERDTGSRLDGYHDCVGAWAMGGEICPEDMECESVHILRWVHDRWVDRGFFYGYCAESVSASGLPYSLADAFVGQGLCDPPNRRVAPENPSGPLGYGDEGPRVLALQRALIESNLLADDADGKYGPNTRAAVADLEFLLGADPDGVADATVLAALGLPA